MRVGCRFGYDLCLERSRRLPGAVCRSESRACSGGSWLTFAVVCLRQLNPRSGRVPSRRLPIAVPRRGTRSQCRGRLRSDYAAHATHHAPVRAFLCGSVPLLCLRLCAIWAAVCLPVYLRACVIAGCGRFCCVSELHGHLCWLLAALMRAHVSGCRCRRRWGTSRRASADRPACRNRASAASSTGEFLQRCICCCGDLFGVTIRDPFAHPASCRAPSCVCAAVACLLLYMALGILIRIPRSHSYLACFAGTFGTRSSLWPRRVCGPAWLSATNAFTCRQREPESSHFDARSLASLTVVCGLHGTDRPVTGIGNCAAIARRREAKWVLSCCLLLSHSVPAELCHNLLS